MSQIIKLLPDIYQKLFPTFFNKQTPLEHYADCNNCSMVHNKKEEGETPKVSFLSNRKCCTYYPNIPNYLIGGLLFDNNSAFDEGRLRIQKKIEERQSVHPFGVYQPRLYDLQYRNQQGGFGNSEALLCPWFHKEQGHCTIWQYREMVCSTYYCKHVNGKVGKEFWNGIKSYLHQSQETLIRYVLQETGFDTLDLINKINQTRPLNARELDGLGYTDEEHEELWGKWAGKELEFYKKAYELVNQLNREKFIVLFGIEESIRFTELQRLKDKCQQVPNNLKSNVVYNQKKESTVKVYLKEIDMSFDLPSIVFEFIDSNSNWKQALKKLEKEGITLEHELVYSLYHHNVLKGSE